MPELPEVEVVRAGLAPAVDGATVTAVEVLDERSLRRHRGPAEDFVERLRGARLREPSRRGKFLWVPLVPRGALGAEAPGAEAPGAEALVVHLGMSGQVLLRAADAPRDRLTRIVLDLAHPVHGPVRLDFVDQRIFGSMALDALVPTPDEPAELIPSQVAHIARDPIDPGFDDGRFLAALRRRDTTIKRALLDQTLVSGIGNIYADEALWAARIHYDQPTRTLSRPRAATLLAEVRHVLGRALAEGGTSFDALYVNVNGASGYFSHSLNAYGQAGRPCPRCGRPIVREQFMNRGSHFCRFCQRLRTPR
ncbi:MAG: bifunctional DNA-formamidopyrimidine glycosylase/DNA-(apurinic or apyrimidinic site) lyase [Micrococcales bacterium]|nr:bifunctional DNA-formamidopyrimidine glycosylase/DNA-(apurinic or apyrimidinic site) lyase [Micrococcales bacterium]